jgi:hypothetical protein
MPDPAGLAQAGRQGMAHVIDTDGGGAVTGASWLG